MTTSQTALLIVRVLACQDQDAPDCQDLKPHFEEIQQRFSELEKTREFKDAAQTALAEWVESQMIACALQCHP